MTLISKYNNTQEKCNYIYSNNNQLKNRWTMLQNFAYLCNNIFDSINTILLLDGHKYNKKAYFNIQNHHFHSLMD